MTSGSCLCGAVQFTVDDEYEGFFLCHCRHCQKDTGSAHAANLFFASAKLNWISGREKVKTFQLPNSRHVKSFCSECGSAMPNLQLNGTLLAVPAGSLDEVISITPIAHIFNASRADWDNKLELLPKFEGLPC